MSTDTPAENTQAEGKKTAPLLNNFRDRFEELLKVKSMEDLKIELSKIGQELQDEIKNFDLQEYLSPTAKDRIKQLESRYAEVMKSLQKAQKQFDREFSKSVRTLKKTKTDAEKRLNHIRSQVEVQRKKVLKASQKIRGTLKKKTTKAKRTTSRKKTS